MSTAIPFRLCPTAVPFASPDTVVLNNRKRSESAAPRAEKKSELQVPEICVN